MKIAHVQPYDHAIPGGVREHVVNLARHQRALGHHVTVVTTASTEDGLGPGVAVVSRSVVAVPIARSIARVSLSPLAWWRVRRLLLAGDHDVVHIHEPLAPMVALAATCHTRTVTVGTVHGYRPEFLPYRLLRRPLDRAMRRLHARIAVSVDARRWVSQYFPADYQVIPGGVDVARFSDSALAPVARWADGRPTVLYVGRLDQRKGFPVLLDAWPQVRRALPGARLLVTGQFDARERDRWARQVRRRGLADVELIGYVPDAELPRYYRTADVFCAPSTGYEALGIVLLEAMAAGLAVVTTDIEGYRTIVRDGAEALVAPPGDVTALADRLIAALVDTDLRARLVANGRQRVQEYDWPRLAERLLQLYASLGAGSAEPVDHAGRPAPYGRP
ncbi:glycosyltransferase family 4 protein [Micromonospora sp. S4605]|uniref:glycosyltransferase family 4 protein n=1 Tax=Micromonospora sp. S4605 TaxID=1420897 RepID=UPI001305395B|nr:glycosyltransferase family 4 protein [Micromonospora sp. S4605]